MSKLAELYTELTVRGEGQTTGAIGRVGTSAVAASSRLSGMASAAAVAFGGIAAGAGIALGGFYAIYRALAPCVAAAADFELEVQKLSTALDMANRGWRAPDMVAWADKIQSITTQSNDQVMSLMTLGLQYGVTGDRIQEVTKGAIGLARAFGMDVQSAMRYAALAEQGEFEALSRMMPAIRGVSDESEKLRIVQEAMARGWTLEREATETLAGSWAQLKNDLGDLAKVIGQTFTPFLSELVGYLKQAVELTTAWYQRAGPLATALRLELEGLQTVAYWMGFKFNDEIAQGLAGIEPTIRPPVLPERAPLSAGHGTMEREKFISAEDAAQVRRLQAHEEAIMIRMAQLREREEGKSAAFVGIADFAKQLQLSAQKDEENAREREKLATMKRQEDALNMIRAEIQKLAPGVRIVGG